MVYIRDYDLEIYDTKGEIIPFMTGFKHQIRVGDVLRQPTGEDSLKGMDLEVA